MRIFRFFFTIFLASLFIACSDDESFTVDLNARLRFSADTVSFDTVFCDIGSSTRRLIVYNKCDKGLRLSQISLLDGDQSSFRMNVDGMFATQVRDVEIPARDSIFIFLETTVAETADTLSHVTNKIQFVLESGVSQSVVLDAYGQKAISLRGMAFESDTMLNSRLPYIIYDSLVVMEGARLTLAAGTKLHFHKGASLFVHGSLSVEGEAGNEVVLRCDRLDNLLWNLPYDLTDAQWGGVVLTSSCTGCDIRYADIHGGSFGIRCDSIAGKLTIQNSTIHNVAWHGLDIRYSEVLVTNSQITNMLGHCLYLLQSQADFYHCTIGQFYRWSANRGHALMLERLSDEQHADDPVRFSFYNCLITGYDQDEVFAEFDQEKTDLGAHFYSCLVNTDIADEKYFTDCIAESPDSATCRLSNFAPTNIPYHTDFHLDTLSVAIGKANPEYTSMFPTDRDGNPHSLSHPDYGCYHFEAKKEE